MKDAVDSEPHAAAQAAVSGRLRALTPWLLLLVAVLLLAAGAAKAFGPSACEADGLNRGASSWFSGDSSLVPPGHTCFLSFADGGSDAVEHRSWLPLLGALVAVSVVVMSIRSRQRSWRQAAAAACVLLVATAAAMVVVVS
jgi:hypothetical protein